MIIIIRKAIIVVLMVMTIILIVIIIHHHLYYFNLHSYYKHDTPCFRFKVMEIHILKMIIIIIVIIITISNIMFAVNVIIQRIICTQFISQIILVFT